MSDPSSTVPNAHSVPPAPPTSMDPYERRAEREFVLAKMRIENSAAYVGRMIWSITIIAGAISVIVVCSVVLIAVIGLFKGDVARIPDVLSNWGGIILGFYFGQFVNLVKDFMGVVSGSSVPPGGMASAEAVSPTRTA